MFPSHYERALLRRRAARSLAAAGIVATATACGNDDAEVFDGAVIPAVAPATTASSPDSPETSAAPTTTSAGSSTTAPTAAPTTPTATTTTVVQDTTTTTTPPSAFPVGGELVVDFTFTPTSTGERIQNPYIAVWIEDLDGALIDTISIWWDADGRRGDRWLRTLRLWSEVTGEVVDPTASGATRPAGTYAVAWDGTDADGVPIEPGTYRVFVEAAREDGPYQVSTAEVVFDGSTFTIDLPADGELFDVSARMIA